MNEQLKKNPLIDSVFDTPGTFVGVLDPEGNIVRINSQALEFIDCTEEEILGQYFPDTPWWDDMPDLRDRLKQGIDQVLEGESIRFDAQHLGPDDTEIYVDFTLTPVYNDSETVQFLLAQGRDITDKIRAKRDLYKERELFRTLIDAIPDSVYFKDKQHRFIRVNKEKANHHDTTPDEMIGNTDFDYFSEDEAQRAWEDDEYVINAGEPIIGKEESVVHSDGSSHWASVTKLPRRSRDGEIIGTMGISRDITELKETQQELIRAQRMEALGELAGGIAHDFNNVLTMISGAVQMVKVKELDGPLEKYIDMIDSAITRGVSVTERLLTFARAKAPEVRPVSLSDFLYEIQDMAQHSLPQNVRIKLRHFKGHDRVLADEAQLQQVLMTLCINAADAMPEGGTLYLGLREVSEDEQKASEYAGNGDYLCITVEDTGIGMDEATQRKIFQPFFTTKQDKEGTGLGLTVAQKIIHSHNGWINVDSIHGQGAIFNVFLPISSEVVAEDLPENMDGIPTGNGESILVVEDETEIRNVIVEVLENNGYRTYNAENGENALSLFRANHNEIDTVLTDLGLPDMNGKQVAKQIREINPDIPIIAITGYVNTEKYKKLFDYGFQTIIQKPCKLQQILESVDQVLNSSE
ncbi:MAG: PAS domain-containing protein [Candidatus Marinimicrobia bacterium]|nr:PAS domain-containing protein [Candidatus Neomarinimicrobiota bacterium]MCF7827902.1 PAS domain-containing protein [Candidatus Neomarinimicrobiota bacterium]MCF7879343.1 PAS domain-containing protein [Candidatus Neomarinimicrobiota bacterium]